MAREARIYLSPMVVVTTERVYDGEKWLDVELQHPEHRSVPLDIVSQGKLRGSRVWQRMLSGKGPTLAVVEAEIEQLETIEAHPDVERVLRGWLFETKEDAWTVLDEVSGELCGRIRAEIAKAGSNLRSGLSNETRPSMLLKEQPKEWDRARRAGESPIVEAHP